jgi:hypothetical protein
MKEIIKYKQLIEEKLYYEAHEVLESLWFPIRKTKNDYALVLKGFINAAVSLELYKRNKFEQSKKINIIYGKYVTKDKIINTTYPKEFNDLKVFVDLKFKEIYK